MRSIRARSLVPDGVVLPVLGNATDPQLLQGLFEDKAVELVFRSPQTRAPRGGQSVGGPGQQCGFDGSVVSRRSINRSAPSGSNFHG